MPEQEEGLMHGFQLWVNLPAKDKMTDPRYQDIAPERIPVVDAGGGVRVRVIAGRFGEVEGPVSAVVTEPIYLDVALTAGAKFEVPLPAAHNAFAYVFEGAAQIAGEKVGRGELAVLGRGDRFEVEAGAEDARFVLIAGRPLHEPVAKYGPFVMNTADEIRQAVYDYQSGKF
jgi:redox-sensitive bicupin YhaK (pirin superfamily)